MVVRVYDAKALPVARWSMEGAATILLGVVGAEMHGLIDAAPDVHWASKQYRKDLVEAFLVEFLTKSSALLIDDSAAAGGFSSGGWSAQTSTAQTFPEGDPAIAPVGVPLPHHSAAEHCNGRAVYTDDEAVPQGCLVCVPVPSTHSRATFEVDDKAARAVPGLVDVLYAKDVLGTNDLGGAGRFLADKEVQVSIGDC